MIFTSIFGDGTNIQRAEYLYQKDIIYAPSETAFKVPENYYTSLLHGLMFWTGHENRLDRLSKLHGTDDEKAIFESLVADIGTGFLCAKFKLNGKWRLSNNLKDQWIQLLRTDPQVIFRAASLANKAYKHLLCLTNLKKNVVLAEEPVEPTESVNDGLCRDEDDTEEL